METRHLIQEKHSQYGQLLSILRSSVRDAVIAEDTNLLHDLLDDIGKDDRNIVRIEITNDENRTLAKLTRGAGNADASELLALMSEVQVGTVTRGTIYLDIDLSHAKRQIADHVLFFVALLFLMLAGLLLVLLWLVNRITLRPIVAVEERLKELGEGTLRSDFVEGGAREMAQLARSLNAVAETLSRQLRQAEDQAKLLRTENRRRIEAQETAEQKNLELQSALSQLKDAQDALVKRERIEALGQMAGGMAHDFNNTLTPIIAASDLLREHRILEEIEVDEFVEMIRTAARDAAELVRGIRREHTQTPDASLQTIRLGSVVKSAIQLAESEMIAGTRSQIGREIQVHGEVEPGLRVWGSETLLRQAIVNLIINAVDAMPVGGTIRVTGTNLGEMIALDVCDEGVGMSQELIEKCMSPLFTTKGELGTGLGLTNVATVAKEFGGTVGIESTINVGTTVRMLFPSTESIASIDRGTHGVSLSVYVVDDEPAVRRGVVRLLERLGHRPTAFETSVSVLDMIREKTPDLLVTDFSMPVMNGAELTVEAANHAPGMPVILMTAFRGAVTSIPGAVELFPVIIDKPVELSSLRYAIGKACHPEG